MTLALKDAVAVAPPSAVGPLVLFDVPLPDLVLLATLVWTLLLIVEKLVTYFAKCTREPPDE
jgi:hypothetical protein